MTTANELYLQIQVDIRHLSEELIKLNRKVRDLWSIHHEFNCLLCKHYRQKDSFCISGGSHIDRPGETVCPAFIEFGPDDDRWKGAEE
jgi:hypothetical protein